MPHTVVTCIGAALLLVALGYSVLALVAVIIWRRQRCTPPSTPLPRVSVLKPLCGAEPDLYQHLRSFCVQQFASYQIVFGLREASDPAYAVAQRLQQEFSHLPIDIVVDERQHGANAKISNLINMLECARHDVLVMADSDTWVGPLHLQQVSAELTDPGIGIVTCLYRGVGTPGLWSRLGALYINDWYLPLVMLAWLFGHRAYVSGQTLALTRATLNRIGGLPAIVDHLADDYRLGELVRAQGLQIRLSPAPVHAAHDEPTYTSLQAHELRWLRTLKVLQPAAFAGLWLTFSVPLALVGALLLAASGALTSLAWSAVGLTLIARIGVHVVNADRPWRDLVWLPLREALLTWHWCRSWSGRGVRWREGEFAVDKHGILHRSRTGSAA